MVGLAHRRAAAAPQRPRRVVQPTRRPAIDAAHGGLGDQAMTLSVQAIECRLGVALNLAQRLRQNVEAFDHLLRRMQPTAALNVAQPESTHGARGNAVRLAAQFEEHADDGEHVLDQGEDVAGFLKIAGGQSRRSGSCALVAALWAERGPGGIDQGQCWVGIGECLQSMWEVYPFRSGGSLVIASA
jgi:hypothetical protein